MTQLTTTVGEIRPLDAAAMAAASELHGRLTKPAGSLGDLEDLSVRLAGLAGSCPPPLPESAVVAVFAGDHGVHAQGVSPWPQEVTAQMVGNFLAGGAVINAFARQAGASVTVVDVGVALPLDPAPGLISAKVRPGTRDLATGPALTREEALAAVEVGITVATDLIAGGADILLTGDMGIANTTPSAALIAAFTGAPAADVTGRGTGIDDTVHAHKVAVVDRALALHGLAPGGPAPGGPAPGGPAVGGPNAAGTGAGRPDALGVLAAVGGLEHAALTGFILAAAARRVPVIVDGVIAASAALAAAAPAPAAVGPRIPGHPAAEPGATVALAHLGLSPLLDLGMRLGEGTGAALALPVVAAAVRVLHEVATFDGAGVSEK